MKKFYCLLVLLLLLTGNVYAQWLPLTGLLGGDIAKLHVYNSNLYAGGTASLFRSTDSGINWTSHLPFPAYAWSIASDANNIYCGVWAGGMTMNSGVYRSTDNGLNWNLIGLANNNISDIAADENQIVAIAFVENNIYKSTNSGQDWFNIKGSLNLGVYVVALSGNRIFAGAQGLHMTTNDGASWSPIFMSDNIESVCVSDSVIFAGTYSTGIFRSSNNGANWQNTLNINKRIKSIYAYNNYVFAGVDSAFYVSTDGGLSFVEKSQGIENASISSTIVKDNYIFVANSNYLSTNVSVWRRPLTEVVSVNDIVETNPSSFSLSQNYPNPFNPSTKISWQSPVGSWQTLKIYDVLGTEIATLIDEYKSAGSYDVDFNAANLSSGVYFYSLTAGSFTKTKKFILMR